MYKSIWYNTVPSVSCICTQKVWKIKKCAIFSNTCCVVLCFPAVQMSLSVMTLMGQPADNSRELLSVLSGTSHESNLYFPVIILQLQNLLPRKCFFFLVSLEAQSLCEKIFNKGGIIKSIVLCTMVYLGCIFLLLLFKFHKQIKERAGMF